MSIKGLIINVLRRKKLMFLSVGFMVVFVWGVGLNPVKAQEKRDTVKQEEPIARFVEIAPDFPGGMQALYEFLKENTKYPPVLSETHIQGTTQIKFVVKKDGAIDSVMVLRSSGSEILDNEAVRVVKLMPNWIPGKVAGKPVATYYYLPIKFPLSNIYESNNSNSKPENEPLKGKKKKK